MKAVYEYMLGLGGAELDPAGGATVLLRKIRAMGLDVPPPYSQVYPEQVAQAVRQIPYDTAVFLGGDSCGANKSPWVAAAVHPRPILGMHLIQASLYCNAGCPPIPDNVREVIVFYSDWRTLGLGMYKAQLAIPPKVGNIYDGDWHTGNSGKTNIKYLFTPDLHPGDDDVVGVQNVILAHIKSRTSVS